MKNKMKSVLAELVRAVRAVRQHRQVAAYESPETQDAWDRLAVATVEANKILVPPQRPALGVARTKRNPHKKLDKRHR